MTFVAKAKWRIGLGIVMGLGFVLFGGLAPHNNSGEPMPLWLRLGLLVSALILFRMSWKVWWAARQDDEDVLVRKGLDALYEHAKHHPEGFSLSSKERDGIGPGKRH